MNEMTGEQINAFLAKQTIGHVGMIRSGRPYVVPVAYLFDQNTVYFATEPGQKLESLQNQPETCFEVDEYVPELGEYRSVVAYGHARLVSDEAERQRLTRSLISRFERHAPTLATSKDYPAHALGQSASQGAGPVALQVVALPLEELHGREV